MTSDMYPLCNVTQSIEADTFYTDRLRSHKMQTNSNCIGEAVTSPKTTVEKGCLKTQKEKAVAKHDVSFNRNTKPDKTFNASQSVCDIIDLTLSDSDDEVAADCCSGSKANEINDNEVVIRVFSFIKDDDGSLEQQLPSTAQGCPVQGQFSLIQNEEDFNEMFERPHNEQLTDSEQDESEDVCSDNDIIFVGSGLDSLKGDEITWKHTYLNGNGKLISNGVDNDITVVGSGFHSTKDDEISREHTDLNGNGNLLSNGIENDISVVGSGFHSPKNNEVTLEHTDGSEFDSAKDNEITQEHINLSGKLLSNRVNNETKSLEHLEMSTVWANGENLSVRKDKTDDINLFQQSFSLVKICKVNDENLKENIIHEESLAQKSPHQPFPSGIGSVTSVEHNSTRNGSVSDSTEMLKLLKRKLKEDDDDKKGAIVEIDNIRQNPSNHIPMSSLETTSGDEQRPMSDHDRKTAGNTKNTIQHNESPQTNQDIQSRARPGEMLVGLKHLGDAGGTEAINLRKSTTEKCDKQNEVGNYKHSDRNISLEGNYVPTSDDLRKCYNKKECHHDPKISTDQIRSCDATNLDNKNVNCNHQQSADNFVPVLVTKDKPVEHRMIQSLLEKNDKESDEVRVSQENSPVLHHCETSKPQDSFSPLNQQPVHHQPQMTKYTQPKQQYLHDDAPKRQFSLLNDHVRPGCCTNTNSGFNTNTNVQKSQSFCVSNVGLPGIRIFLTHFSASPTFATLSSGNLRTLYSTNNSTQQCPQMGCRPSSFNLAPEVMHSNLVTHSPQTVHYISPEYRSQKTSSDGILHTSRKAEESPTLINKASSQNADYSMNSHVAKEYDIKSNSHQNKALLTSGNQSVPEIHVSAENQSLSVNTDDVPSSATSDKLSCQPVNCKSTSREEDIAVMKSYYTQANTDTELEYPTDHVADIHRNAFSKRKVYSAGDQKRQAGCAKSNLSEQASKQLRIDISLRRKRKRKDGPVSLNCQHSSAKETRKTHAIMTTKRKQTKDVHACNPSVNKKLRELISCKQKSCSKPTLSVDEVRHTITVLDTDTPTNCIGGCYILEQGETETRDYYECSHELPSNRKMGRTSRLDPEKNTSFTVDSSVRAGMKKSSGVCEEGSLKSYGSSNWYVHKDLSSNPAQFSRFANTKNKASKCSSITQILPKRSNEACYQRSDEALQRIPKMSNDVRDTIWTIVKERNQPEHSTESELRQDKKTGSVSDSRSRKDNNDTCESVDESFISPSTGVLEDSMNSKAKGKLGSDNPLETGKKHDTHGKSNHTYMFEKEFQYFYEDHDSFYVCEICSDIHNRKINIRKHIFDHLRRMFWHCPTCKESCGKPDHYKRMFTSDPVQTFQEQITAVRKVLGTVIIKCGVQSHFQAYQDLKPKLEHLYLCGCHKFKCLICEKYYLTMFSMHKHLLQKHLQHPLFRCLYCEFGSISRYKVSQHVKDKHATREVCVLYNPVRDSLTLAELKSCDQRHPEVVVAFGDNDTLNSADIQVDRTKNFECSGSWNNQMKTSQNKTLGINTNSERSDTDLLESAKNTKLKVPSRDSMINQNDTPQQATDSKQLLLESGLRQRENNVTLEHTPKAVMQEVQSLTTQIRKVYPHTLDMVGENVNAEYTSTKPGASIRKPTSVRLQSSLGDDSYSVNRKERLPLQSSSSKTSFHEECSGQNTSDDSPKRNRSKFKQSCDFHCTETQSSIWPNRVTKHRKRVTNIPERVNSKETDTQTQENSQLSSRLYPLYKNAKEEVLSGSKNNAKRYHDHTSVTTSVTSQSDRASADCYSWDSQKPITLTLEKKDGHLPLTVTLRKKGVQCSLKKARPAENSAKSFTYVVVYPKDS